MAGDDETSYIDLPFEENPPGQTLDVSNAVLSGGLIIVAAAVPVPEHGMCPALLFRFTDPHGAFYDRPILLVVDDEHAAKLTELVAQSVASARAKAAAA
jgi:hypothetical protein